MKRCEGSAAAPLINIYLGIAAKMPAPIGPADVVGMKPAQAKEIRAKVEGRRARIEAVLKRSEASLEAHPSGALFLALRSLRRDLVQSLPVEQDIREAAHALQVESARVEADTLWSRKAVAWPETRIGARRSDAEPEAAHGARGLAQDGPAPESGLRLTANDIDRLQLAASGFEVLEDEEPWIEVPPRRTTKSTSKAETVLLPGETAIYARVEDGTPVIRRHGATKRELREMLDDRQDGRPTLREILAALPFEFERLVFNLQG